MNRPSFCSNVMMGAPSKGVYGDSEATWICCGVGGAWQRAQVESLAERCSDVAQQQASSHMDPNSSRFVCLDAKEKRQGQEDLSGTFFASCNMEQISYTPTILVLSLVQNGLDTATKLTLFSDTVT